jgi:hypothetical protein
VSGFKPVDCAGGHEDDECSLSVLFLTGCGLRRFWYAIANH